MKKLFFLSLLFCSLTGYSQEFSSEEGFYIGKREVTPSLSFLSEKVPASKFTLMEVNFKKNEKREVNMMAVMERERYERESAYIELENPAPRLGKFETGVIQFSNEVRFHDRGSNYDIYTGKTKNPAYKEMRTGLFHGHYSPFTGRSYTTPVQDPYLR
ncbi:hypothetical protein [Salinimicrobium gaetbulicola]|uniref:Uncharacterized protein n=1 Tax=Salinimicrobium gaetbulicola TaxID=999702 RepID=A0ABW3ID49_9FLAO